MKHNYIKNKNTHHKEKLKHKCQTSEKQLMRMIRMLSKLIFNYGLGCLNIPFRRYFYFIFFFSSFARDSIYQMSTVKERKIGQPGIFFFIFLWIRCTLHGCRYYWYYWYYRFFVCFETNAIYYTHLWAEAGGKHNGGQRTLEYPASARRQEGW